MSANGGKLLEIRDLDAYYGTAHVLQHVGGPVVHVEAGDLQQRCAVGAHDVASMPSSVTRPPR